MTKQKQTQQLVYVSVGQIWAWSGSGTHSYPGKLDECVFCVTCTLQKKKKHTLHRKCSFKPVVQSLIVKSASRSDSSSSQELASASKEAIVKLTLEAINLMPMQDILPTCPIYSTRHIFQLCPSARLPRGYVNFITLRTLPCRWQAALHDRDS